MDIATTVIGLLPTYETIGVWAPVLLVAMRFCQGLGVGGESGGAVLMVVEAPPPEKRGHFGAFPQIADRDAALRHLPPDAAELRRHRGDRDPLSRLRMAAVRNVPPRSHRGARAGQRQQRERVGGHAGIPREARAAVGQRLTRPSPLDAPARRSLAVSRDAAPFI